MDFQRGGTVTRRISCYVPFISAAVQGLDRLVRAARVSPGDPSTSCQDDVKGEARSEPATGDLPAQDVDRAPVRRQAERDTNGGRRA
jgi:hypothetical protein